MKTWCFRVIHSTVVTAQGHVGETEGRSKFWDKNNLYTGRLSEGEVEEVMEEMSATYVVRRVGG